MKKANAAAGVLKASLVALFFVSTASAATIFLRDLPNTTNTNFKNGTANLSNYSFPPGNDNGVRVVLGDDFRLPVTPGGFWNIDTLSVWITSNFPASSPVTPNNEFGSISLFLGADPTQSGATLNLVSSTYTYQRVVYSPGIEDYQAANGTFYPIYKITFTGLNLVIPADEYWDFAIDATGSNLLNLHATASSKAGTQQDWADDVFLGFEGLGNQRTLCCVYGNLNLGTITNPSNPSDTGPYNGLDINVEITGSAVPEPATLLLFGAGLLGLGVLRRHRR